MKQSMPKLFSIALILAMVVSFLPAKAQHAQAAGTVSLTTLGSAYTENFDSLANTGTSSTVPSGWDFIESGTNANTTYAAGTGSDTGGNTYSFGSASSTERAFGGLLSGSLVPTIGASFSNNTGATINSLDITYYGEEWRLGTAARTDRLEFQYSLDATSLTTGTWTGVTALNFVTPDTVTTGAKNGNAISDRTQVSASIAGLNIANGGTFWIRWNDFNASGADDGLAVDDFSLTPQGGVSTNPSGMGAASPNWVLAGADTLLTVVVTPGAFPTSTGLAVSCDLTSIGGPTSQSLYDDGTNGDVSEGDKTFSFQATVDSSTSIGTKNLACSISDNEARSGTATISLAVHAPGNVVISQVYGGGGNSGATLKNDFIELYNRSASEVDLTGWSVQYASAAGSSWQVTNLSGSLAPGKNYLVQEAAGSGGSVDLPVPDAIGSILMSATNGKVALVNNQIPLTDACPAGIVDLVGYGAANCYETAATPALTNTTAAIRIGGGTTDTDNNFSDFITGAPIPHNRVFPFNGSGLATPNAVFAGSDSLLTMTVTPGAES